MILRNMSSLSSGFKNKPSKLRSWSRWQGGLPPASCLFLPWPILWSWKWRWRVTPKHGMTERTTRHYTHCWRISFHINTIKRIKLLLSPFVFTKHKVITKRELVSMLVLSQLHLTVQGVHVTRKWGFKWRSRSTFLRDYPAFPRQRKCWRSVIPSRQFLYMHTFIRILYKNNTNLPWFITGAEIDPVLLANMPHIA
jgi:hypothetical protein